MMIYYHQMMCRSLSLHFGNGSDEKAKVRFAFVQRLHMLANDQFILIICLRQPSCYGRPM